MEIINVGKNTKNAEGVKIPGEIKKAFTKYLKAQQYLQNEKYEKVSVELLFASWLATFEASEEYKAVIEEAEAKKQAELKEKIAELLAGRVAESIVFGDISGGASNDIQRASDLARDMVSKYGFSEKLGPINYSDSEEVFLGREIGHSRNYGEEVAALIDSEIRRIVEEAHQKAKDLLQSAFPDCTFEVYPLSPAFITQGGPNCLAVQYIEK